MNKTSELPVIVALDNMSPKSMTQFCERHKAQLTWVKIGMQAFYATGREFLLQLKERTELKIFLDLKLHDIPNTVAKAVESLSGLPVDFLTVHLSGGRQMLSSALEAAQKSLPHTQLLGVTFLTSLGSQEMQELWEFDDESWRKAFYRYLDMATDLGMPGIVCSAQDLQWLHQVPKYKSLLKICPGIRFQDEIDSGQIQDQKRVLSPLQAKSYGADYLVMGRSLTQTKNLDQRLQQLMVELAI